MTTIGDVPDSTNVSDDPPPTFTIEETTKPTFEEDLSDDLIFKDDSTIVGVISSLTSLNMLQNPSYSKPFYDFGLSSPFEESQEEHDEANKKFSPRVSLESDQDPLALLELRYNVASAISKVDSLDKKVAGLDSMIDKKLTSLNFKLELILKSLSKMQATTPSELDRANHLDQLISLRLKQTIEEVQYKCNDSLDHHISTTTIMLKINDDMINATNELIRKNHVRHEKEIQRLEKEIHKKDAMNMIMQEVLIKLIRATWNIVDVRNNKFDEMLVILDETFSYLKAQAFTNETYDSLTKQLKTIFQRVFEPSEELKHKSILASEVGPSHARGGRKRKKRKNYTMKPRLGVCAMR
ncbi:unnamed protein product [Lactuca saligna]|uniref:Uncharacterized protein n=1 Tax=Lactuca saligna TaxID=75948 RepID=A0AA35URT3_LACSI|nr:unnamed protein product [Lactuca saligna]